ncbi:hypothetical protein BH10PAT1_BH10PAT1_4640 [soil metagenome]
MLSVIIPVLNEENYIEKLLLLLVNQTFQDFEVIIVDGKSVDNTINVIKNFTFLGNKLKLIKAPHKGVSYQRNLGAFEAKFNLLLFLDADVYFESDFLEKIIKEFNPHKYAIAAVKSFPKDKNFIDMILSFLYNYYQEITKSFAPEIYGWMILVKKETHKKINGFDEKMIFSEDSDYVKKIVKSDGKFQILKNGILYSSSRRINKEGRIRFELKMLKYFFVSRLFGKYSAQDKIDYFK